jgi:RND superfamily putative drug exporter
VITGRWVFWPVKPGYGSAEPTTRGVWARVGNRIAARPRTIWIATVLVLGVMAIGVAGLQAHGLTNAQSFRGHPDSVTGETVLNQHFPGGAGQPVQVFGSPSSGPQLATALRSVSGLTDVTKPVSLAGHAYLEATLTSAPDSQAAYDTIGRARAATAAVPGADALVGGNTAVNLDVQQAAAHDRTLIIPIILAVVFVILMLLLRALVAPIMLIATVVLSFGAALGVSAFFFNHVFNFDAADTSFPLFVFVFLVALGIDYNIFLMTRVREETKRQGARQGALTGLSVTGGVITSAGAVLAGTFAVLGTLPVTFLTEIGFAVAFGVLLDTIVVRSVLVTALNLDLGRRVWWPSGLSRQRAPAPDAVPDEHTSVP